MKPKLAFAGGLRLSWHCLKTLCQHDGIPTVAFGYHPSLSHRSGYRDLGDLCRQYHIEYHRIRDINTPHVTDRIKAHDIDLFLVWNWSQLVREPLLSAPNIGCLGMHPTKLPQGRGRAPIPWSIIKGVRHSAVTIFFLTPGVDDGDIVHQEPFDIVPNEDATTLYGRLEAIHETAVKNFCRLLTQGPLPRTPQDHTQATTWPKRRPEDGLIDLTKTTEHQLRWIRALTDPYPGAFTYLRSHKYLIWKAAPAHGKGEPGTILGLGPNQGVIMATADTAIEILSAQCSHQPRTPAADFLARREWNVGDTFADTPS